jgi:D-alanyl-D-alanine carboxypeptidase (penicillin-binding protein 5/6)
LIFAPQKSIVPETRLFSVRLSLRAVARVRAVKKIIITFCLAFLFWGDYAAARSAPVAHGGFEAKSDYAVLIDVETGAVLYDKNGDQLMAPASMSKLMTLEVLFSKLKEGVIALDTDVIASENAWRAGGAPSGNPAMFVPLNATAKVEELIQGIIVQSGNDACIMLAEHLAGTEDAFAMVMTERARAIGLEKSTFGNSTGLPNPTQLMTARELGKLALHIVETYPEYYKYFGVKEFKYRTHPFRNRNPLLWMNLGVDGMKTGHTEDSGYGVVGSAVKDGRRLIVVVNGAKSSREMRDDAARLLAWGFANFQTYTLFDADEIVGEARVWGGEKRYVNLRGDGPIRILLPRTVRHKQIKARIAYEGPLKPPVKEGAQVGELRVTSESGVSNTIPLYAAENVPPGGVVWRGLDTALLRAFGWLL